MEKYIYIVTPLIAWTVAQSLKHVFVSYNKKRKVIDQPDQNENALLMIAPSGGMPSAHSATVVALATIIGMVHGFESELFAVSILFAAVIMYDAMMVRYSSGEQGEAILSILKELKSGIKKPKVAKGHLLSEVLVGALIGWVVAFVVFLITR
jgi:acid phosphatase family membrane protein YuiD